MSHLILFLLALQAKTLIVDMAFVLEGKEESSLPEKLLGCVRMKYLEFKDRDGQRLCSK